MKPEEWKCSFIFIYVQAKHLLMGQDFTAADTKTATTDRKTQHTKTSSKSRRNNSDVSDEVRAKPEFDRVSTLK